ncbi:MAG: hypothetical protein ABIO36_02805, partial [Pyrinomonadaceae bacterium]
MTLEYLNSELQTLVGESVSFCRVASNSLIIYFFGEPGDANVVSIFLDPTWRLKQNGKKIILESFDLQIEESDFESESDYNDEFERLTSLKANLYGSKLESVELDFDSSDICLKFSGDQVVSNFANSAFDDKAWTYRNMQQNI